MCEFCEMVVRRPSLADDDLAIPPFFAVICQIFLGFMEDEQFDLYYGFVRR